VRCAAVTLSLCDADPNHPHLPDAHADSDAGREPQRDGLDLDQPEPIAGTDPDTDLSPAAPWRDHKSARTLISRA
jgi:hypothetical protein